MRYATAYTYGIPLTGFENIPSPTGSIAVDTQGSRGYPNIANGTPINFVGGVSDYYDDNAYVVISDTTTAGLVGRITGGGDGGPVVTIGTQLWMVRNLDVDSYRNGDPIEQVSDPSQWSNLTTGAWCWYRNDIANGSIYGKLYNWYAINDPRGLAPTGFHIPTEAEWLTLMSTLGGSTVAGGAMKSKSGWNEPNTGATNSSGFTSLPGGSRYGGGIRRIGLYWSSSEIDSLNAIYFSNFYLNADLFQGNSNKSNGISVRCIKDDNSGVATEQVPTFWASKLKTDISFLDLVNRLPKRSGEEAFANNAGGLFGASNWLLSNGYWTSYNVNNLTFAIYNGPNFDIPSYLVDPDNSNFTIEWWVYLDDNQSSVFWSIGSNLTHAFSIDGEIIKYWIGGNVVLSSNPGYLQSYVGSWSYFTVTRYGDTIGIFQNGGLIATGSYAGSIPTNGLALYLGSKGDGNILKGKMTNFRWSSENLYGIPSVNFTPPTEPLSVLASTKLLIFQGTDLSAQITDQSVSGYTITNASGFYSPNSPFGVFEGSIDFLFVVGFTFKVDNTLGNAGSNQNTVTSFYSFGLNQNNSEMYINWGDGSALQYYARTNPQEIYHTFAYNGIFDVTCYVKDPTFIDYTISDDGHGNFQMLEVDYSRLINATYINLNGNKLSSTQVNKLLSELVANGLSNGTLLTNSQTPPAPPTGQGIIDKATLISRNWTVTTD